MLEEGEVVVVVSVLISNRATSDSLDFRRVLRSVPIAFESRSPERANTTLTLFLASSNSAASTLQPWTDSSLILRIRSPFTNLESAASPPLNTLNTRTWP
eukprot:Lithocolla_globosa_v1_NODE_4711_length_1382_cov_7.220799.p2 type:complete len:100 gc:universal NODE_4711_length_1382_cov_7.220799:450-151(-)